MGRGGYFLGFKREFHLRERRCNTEELNNHERKPLEPCEETRTKKKMILELMHNNFDLSSREGIIVLVLCWAENVAAK